MAQVELNCEMKSDNCANKISQSLDGLTGVSLDSIDVSKQQVIIEVSKDAKFTIPDIQVHIEKLTGIKTVIKGVGGDVATVSEFNGPDDLIGVIRLAKLDTNQCFVDGVIDGLSDNIKHCRLDVHEYGDLRGDSFENVGPVTMPLLSNVKPSGKRWLFRGSVDDCKLSSVIGRSLVIKDQDKNRTLSAAIIARVSPVHGNTKKICYCSGKTIWDERDEKRQSAKNE